MYKHKDEPKQSLNYYDPDIDLESNSKLNHQTYVYERADVKNTARETYMLLKNPIIGGADKGCPIIPFEIIKIELKLKKMKVIWHNGEEKIY